MRFFFLILVLILGSTALGKQRDCDKTIQDGIYRLKPNTQAALNAGGDYKIIRKRNKQKEIFNNGQSKAVYRIHWESCDVYTLTTRRQVNMPDDWQFKVGDVFRFELLEANADGFKVLFRLGSDKLEIEFIRVEE